MFLEFELCRSQIINKKTINEKKKNNQYRIKKIEKKHLFVCYLLMCNVFQLTATTVHQWFSVNYIYKLCVTYLTLHLFSAYLLYYFWKTGCFISPWKKNINMCIPCHQFSCILYGDKWWHLDHEKNINIS